MVSNLDLVANEEKERNKIKKTESEEDSDEKYSDDFESSSYADETEEDENVNVDEEIIEKVELPANIKQFKPPCLKERKTVHFDCSEDEGEDEDEDEEQEQDEEQDEVQNEKQNKSTQEKNNHKSENLSKKRFVAAFMIFPMMFAGIIMVFEMFGKFKWEKTAMQLTAVVGGAVIALVFLARLPLYRSILKLVLCFAWIIFLLPTYQVYQCSPIELKNDMIGTWFSVKTDAFTFLESTYTTSNCFKSLSLHAPYSMSAMSPKVILKVDIDDLISLNNETLNENDEAQLGYFLMVSKRSVKQRFHKLYLLAVAPMKEASLLEKSLKLSLEEKQRNILSVSGSILNIDQFDLPLKEELESLKYLVRPIKFRVESVKYINRYAKVQH